MEVALVSSKASSSSSVEDEDDSKKGEPDVASSTTVANVITNCGASIYKLDNGMLKYTYYKNALAVASNGKTITITTHRIALELCP